MVSRDSGALRMEIVQSLKHDIERVCQANFGTVRRIYTDASVSFNRMWKLGTPFVVVHAREYARGDVHTNYVENAWSLFKRGLLGQFHHCKREAAPGLPRRVRVSSTATPRERRDG